MKNVEISISLVVPWCDSPFFVGGVGTTELGIMPGAHFHSGSSTGLGRGFTRFNLEPSSLAIESFLFPNFYYFCSI